ncbi:hypothetical protein [Paraglaciecola sp.]|uniref:hypothetical protein n=1 Tax=Paraglaciecola sp. TaxID=1920173 RepID=UPI0030F3AB62
MTTLLSMLETSEVLIMNKNNQTISVAQAQSALESLAKIDRDTNLSLRPPLWLNLIISGSYGMGVFSWTSSRHENLWMLGLIISALIFFLAVAFYLYRSRLLGLKPKVAPKNKSELIFGLSTALFFGVAVALATVFSKSDIEWVPYVGAATTTLVLAILLHCYPCGEYYKSANHHE